MTALGAARLRARAEQHLVQRRRSAPPAASTPSRGTSSSRARPAGATSARGSTCAKVPGFGTVFTIEVDPSIAVFVPRGVGNSYQTLPRTSPPTATSSTTTGRPGDQRLLVLNLADETVAIPWPIPLDRGGDLREGPGAPAARRRRSAYPRLKTLILGGNGQLGRALRCEFPDADQRRPRPSSTSPTPRRSRRGRGPSTTSCSTPPPTPRSTGRRRPTGAARGVGGERRPCRRRSRGSLASTGITLVHVLDATTSSTGPRGRTARGRALLAAGRSTARPRPPATSPSATPRHYLVRTSLGHRRRQQLRAHDAGPGRARHLARAWSTTRSVG